ncbi:hypothetical protein QLR68_13630 [Micromonospora sp. DH15]|nr:hypothetical protein [Micromonospora sp. DH15]
MVGAAVGCAASAGVGRPAGTAGAGGAGGRAAATGAGAGATAVGAGRGAAGAGGWSLNASTGTRFDEMSPKVSRGTPRASRTTWVTRHASSFQNDTSVRT